MQAHENLSNTLERLHTALATLDSVFPPLEDPLASIDFPEESVYDKSYTSTLQPLIDIDRVKDGYEMGREFSLGCLAPLLLAASMEHNDKVDFKAYSLNFLNIDNSLILSIGTAGHNTDNIEEVVRLWIDKCDLPNCRKDVPTRRCIVVAFSSLFNHHGATKTIGLHKPNYIGHAITLGLELHNRVLTLRIYDQIMHQYVHAVHDQFFNWMIASVKLHHTLYDSLHTELVCLADKIHVDGLFMTCMSVAYRVCMYISKTGVVDESEKDFTEDSLSFKKHIYRMIKWVKENKSIKNHENAVLISPAMNKLVYEINKENCYFIMAPYSNEEQTQDYSTSSVKLRKIDEKIKKRLRYSIANGFEEKQE